VGGQSGEVDDGLDAPADQGVLQAAPISQVADNKVTRRDSLGLAAREVVVHDLVTALEEQACGVAADVASPLGDEDAHDAFSRRVDACLNRHS
jgi:hypothetical protein